MGGWPCGDADGGFRATYRAKECLSERDGSGVWVCAHYVVDYVAHLYGKSVMAL